MVCHGYLTPHVTGVTLFVDEIDPFLLQALSRIIIRTNMVALFFRDGKGPGFLVSRRFASGYPVTILNTNLEL